MASELNVQRSVQPGKAVFWEFSSSGFPHRHGLDNPNKPPTGWIERELAKFGVNISFPTRDPSSYGFGDPIELKNNPNNIRNVSRYTRRAIKFYNQHNGTNYKGVKIKGTNRVVVAGIFLYITFEAKDEDRDDGQCKTFYAEVFRGIRSKAKIKYCGLERTYITFETDNDRDDGRYKTSTTQSDTKDTKKGEILKTNDEVYPDSPSPSSV